MLRNSTVTLSVPNLPGMLPDRQAWLYVRYFFVDVFGASFMFISPLFTIREKKRALRRVPVPVQQAWTEVEILTTSTKVIRPMVPVDLPLQVRVEAE